MARKLQFPVKITGRISQAAGDSLEARAKHRGVQPAIIVREILELELLGDAQVADTVPPAHGGRTLMFPAWYEYSGDETTGLADGWQYELYARHMDSNGTVELEARSVRHDGATEKLPATAKLKYASPDEFFEAWGLVR